MNVHNKYNERRIELDKRYTQFQCIKVILKGPLYLTFDKNFDYLCLPLNQIFIGCFK